MYYNQDFGKETLIKEYKRFTFNHCGLPFDVNDSEYLIKSGQWKFNKYIKQHLHKNIEIYLPKYISAFMNPLSETDFGELYLGIDDNGIVSGIPFQGNLDPKFIKSIIKKTINKFIKIDNNSAYSINDIKKFITFKLIELDYNNIELEEPMPLLKKYHEIKFKEKYKEMKYKKALDVWYKKIFLYIQKLTILFNTDDTRQELYNYIKLENPNSNVLKMMDNGYILPQESYENVNIFKHDKTSPFHWICKWKDEIIDNYKKNKPMMPIKSSLFHFVNPITILTKLSPMIPWWMQKNTDMKLYVIRITIRKPTNNVNLHYIDMFGSYNQCFRTTYFENNEYHPCCYPTFL